MEMNGIAHIQLTVNDCAAARASCGKLLARLEMTAVLDSPQMIYGPGSRTGVAISPGDPRFRDGGSR